MTPGSAHPFRSDRSLTWRLVWVALLRQEWAVRKLSEALGYRRHVDCDCMECLPWTY